MFKTAVEGHQFGFHVFGVGDCHQIVVGDAAQGPYLLSPGKGIFARDMAVGEMAEKAEINARGSN